MLGNANSKRREENLDEKERQIITLQAMVHLQQWMTSVITHKRPLLCHHLSKYWPISLPLHQHRHATTTGYGPSRPKQSVQCFAICIVSFGIIMEPPHKNFAAKGITTTGMTAFRQTIVHVSTTDSLSVRPEVVAPCSSTDPSVPMSNPLPSWENPRTGNCGLI